MRQRQSKNIRARVLADDYEGRRSRGIAVYADFKDWWHGIKKMHDQA